MPVRIRPIQHNYLTSKLGTGIHQLHHRNIIGIIPQTYILNIDQQDIERPHRLIGRTPRLAIVQRTDFYTRLRIDRAGHMFSRIGIAPETMLRRKNRHHIDTVGHQHVNQMAVSDHTRVIGENRHPLPRQGTIILPGTFGTHDHRTIGRINRKNTTNQTQKQNRFFHGFFYILIGVFTIYL